MRLVPALARSLGVFLLLAALVFAGSTATREGGRVSRAHDGGVAAVTSDVAAPAERRPLPDGGTPLGTAKPCEATSVRPDAQQLQTALRTFASDDWRSSDGGVSAPLADGRVVWMFGDTIKVPGHRASGMAPNSMLISSGACFSQYQPAGHGPVIPADVTPERSVDIWPTAVVSVDRGGWSELLVLGNRVRRSRGFWNFQLLGTSLARFAVPDGGSPRLLDVRQLTRDDDAPGHVTWGTAAVRADGWVYVYGTQVVGGSLGRQLFVARTRLDDLGDVGHWQVFDGRGWGAGVARPIVGAQPGMSHVVSVVERDGAWYVVSKVGGDLGDDVGIWTARAPQGPFVLAARERHPYAVTRQQIRYMPLAHPELSVGRRMLVTMSRNVTGGSDVNEDFALGRPEFFTMTLP